MSVILGVPSISSLFPTLAISSSEKLMNEYLALGITEDEAKAAFEANIMPSDLHAILPAFNVQLADMSFGLSPKYKIPLRDTPRIIPDARRRKSRLRV